MTLDQLLSEVPAGGDGPGSVELAPHQVTDDLRSIDARQLGEARASINGLGQLLGDPQLASSLHQSLLVSTGTDTPDALRPAYVDRVNTQLGSVEGAVTCRTSSASRSPPAPAASRSG